ncbi:MAG: hypothetical protein IPI49_13775 [Myxococcales bacterium]|nr:hypothetical protein [Myxococcales bacterium]HRC56597.1 hypothetical protein [Kofleriaceae bacterium]
MTSPDLDAARAATPHCTGLALFQGSPLELVAQSGEPSASGLADWGQIGEAVPALLYEGPTVTSEVLVRLPNALLLVAERVGGVVAVVIDLQRAGLGVSLVHARVAASRVGG